MRFCDFFSGIGGFRLGLERAGHKGVWACEIDDFCRKIYTRHFEEPQGKDINDVKAEEIPSAEIWCGGFPCQDNSVAGQRRGFRGSRSSVFWPWLRLIRQVRPKWLLIENVPGLYSVGEGLDFGLILRRLGDVGYGLSWRSLDAQFFGLAQRRKRVFIVGCFGKPCPPEILFEREGGGGDTAAERKPGGDIAHAIRSGASRADKPSSTTYVIKGAAIGRKPEAGPQRGEVCEGTSYTLNTTEVHAVAPTLYASGAGTERTASAGNEAQFVVAGFMAGQGAKARSIAYREEQSPTLKAAESGTNQAPCIVGTLKQRHDGSAGTGGGNPIIIEENTRNELRVRQSPPCVQDYGGKQKPWICGTSPPPDTNGMREATGLPGWLDTPDSPRYKALGNAVAVPVIEWIGKRLPK